MKDKLLDGFPDRETAPVHGQCGEYNDDTLTILV
jgi:hypothetical protein